MIKLITILLTALILMSCTKNNQSNEVKVIDENDKEEYNGINADSISINQQDQPNSTLNKGQFMNITLDSLRSFNSENALKQVFGENVKRSIGYYPEGTGEYNNTLLYPNSKNEVEFVWEDDSISFKNLLYLKLDRRNTDWKTKEGITIGTHIKDLEAINKRPFTFYGLGWDYGGTIDWQRGYLDDRKLSGRLIYPEESMPNKFNSLLGDHEVKSSSKSAEEANLMLGEITMRKLNK